MEIYTFVLGDFQTNSFCVRPSASSSDCVIIDAGLNAHALVEFLEDKQFNPVTVILTHGHADHIAGVNLLKEKFPDIKVAVHKDDAKMLSNPVKNLSIIAGETLKISPPDTLIENSDTVEFAGLTFKVLHTPGHTPGGISLYCPDEKVVFVGDALFAGSIGRTDFPGGNLDTLLASIREKLFALPDDTRVLTGHGPETTIENEKRYNPFVN